MKAETAIAVTPEMPRAKPVPIGPLLMVACVSLKDHVKPEGVVYAIDSCKNIRQSP